MADEEPQVEERLKRSRTVRDALHRQIERIDIALILVTIGSVAYADWMTGRETSVGFLYLIPLSYSIITQSKMTSAILLAACVAMRQWFGPLELGGPTALVRDLVLTSVFLALVAVLARLGRQRGSFFESAYQQRNQLLREMELAAQVQRNLLDRNAPPECGLDIAAEMRPAKAVGGDYYDFLDLGGGSVALILGDVAGKGLAAAMLMPAVQIALETFARQMTGPAEALKALNQLLWENIGQANYATLAAAVVQPREGRLSFASGGHLPGVLFQPGQAEPQLLMATGLPIGLFPNVEYETIEADFPPGSILVLYSDGITEQRNAQGEDFGLERLIDVVRPRQGDSAAEIAAAVREKIASHRGAEDRDDDATLIVVKLPLNPGD